MFKMQTTIVVITEQIILQINMSTKADIIALINTNLASGGTIPASAHRAALHTSAASVVENFYGTQVTDTNASTNVVTESSSTKTYVIRVIKQGRRVNIQGTITNGTGAILPSDTDWFSITTTEYEQNASPYYFTGFVGGTNEPVAMVLTSDVLGTLQSVGIGETIYFNISYNTNA